MITSSPIKLLLVTTSDRMAGAEKSIYDLCRCIDKTKFSIEVVIFKHEKNGELHTKLNDLGIPVTLLYIQSKWHFYKLISLWRIIRKNRPHILESFLYFDNQVCRIFGTLLHVPIVISGLQNVETRRPWWRNIVDRITMRFADAVISNSDAARTYYEEQHYCSKEKIWIAKSGIDLQQLEQLQVLQIPNHEHRTIFGVSIPHGYSVLFTVGFLTQQKGTKYLIQALHILKEREKKFICFIAGQGDLKEELVTEMEKLGLQDMVHFLGYVQSSYQYLPLMDVFVLPSLWEGLPNVIIEAMASHIPVVATDVGGVKELVEHRITGYLVPAADADAFAGAIEEVLSLSPTAKKQMVDTAYQKIVDSYSVTAMVHSYVQCYDHFLKSYENI